MTLSTAFISYYDIFQRIPLPILVIDQRGKILGHNERAAQFFEETELLGRKISVLCPDCQALIGTRSSETSDQREKEMIQLPVNYQDKRMLVSKLPFSVSDVTYYCLIFREALTFKEDGKLSFSGTSMELQEIINYSFDEIFITDGEGNTLWINDKVCTELYGVNREALIGKNVYELEREEYFTPSITVKALEEKRRVTSTQKTKTGKRLIVTSNPIFDKTGNVTKVVTNSRDITEYSELKERLEELEDLASKYKQEAARLKQEKIKITDLIDASPAMEPIKDLIGKVAKVDTTILMKGESGVGKSLIASKIAQYSERSDKPFVTVNCGSIPENLLESELFGYVKGAFTGASKEGKPGLIEMGDKGTVFLDEVAEIPLNLQVKLLDVLQENRVRRIGANSFKQVDVRIIAATNRDIEKLVQKGKFREDLYYRLNVIPVNIPPLRQRQEDINRFANYFLKIFCDKLNINRKIAPDTYPYLQEYHWPGNVRELENLIERLVVTTDNYYITPDDLPAYIREAAGRTGHSHITVNGICSLKKARQELERELLKRALEKYQTTYQVAQALGVDQSTVVRKINQCGLKAAGRRKHRA